MLIDALVHLAIAKSCDDLRNKKRTARQRAETMERMEALRQEQARRMRELEAQQEKRRARIDKILADNERREARMRRAQMPSVCPGCGAPVRGEECEYCGTRF